MSRNKSGPMGELLPWFDRLVAMAGEHGELLDDMDLDFIDSINDRRRKYGAATTVSVKQVKWLRDIRRKLIAGGAVECEDADAGLEPTDARLGGCR